jgi:hypothetical protein
VIHPGRLREQFEVGGMDLEVLSSHPSALAPARKTLRVRRSEYPAPSIPLRVSRSEYPAPSISLRVSRFEYLASSISLRVCR